MTDKELIKQEIERRINEYKNWIGYQTDSNYLELKELLQFIDSLPEKSVSEDLEDAAYHFCMEEYGNPKESLFEFDQRCFIAGAEWQKQQMMKDAVELTITNTSFIPLPKLDIKAGDKVKIIIVKTEQK